DGQTGGGQLRGVVAAPGGKLRRQLRAQLVVKRAAVGAHCRPGHLQAELRRGQLVRGDLEHQLLGVGESHVDVARQRIVRGKQQVERAEQVQRVVFVGHLPQQRHRRRLSRGGGSAGLRIRRRHRSGGGGGGGREGERCRKRAGEQGPAEIGRA